MLTHKNSEEMFHAMASPIFSHPILAGGAPVSDHVSSQQEGDDPKDYYNDAKRITLMSVKASADDELLETPQRRSGERLAIAAEYTDNQGHETLSKTRVRVTNEGAFSKSNSLSKMSNKFENDELRESKYTKMVSASLHSTGVKPSRSASPKQQPSQPSESPECREEGDYQ